MTLSTPNSIEMKANEIIIGLLNPFKSDYAGKKLRNGMAIQKHLEMMMSLVSEMQMRSRFVITSNY